MSERSLPEFTVRRSDRARRVRLTVSPRDGLVVVVPKRYRGDVAAIVAQKREWAERALAKVAARRKELNSGPEALLPSVVDLPGIGFNATVEYRETGSAGVRVTRREHTLVVSGRIDDAQACLDALRRWLAAEAKRSLPARVRSMADRHGLAPSAIRIGGAKTRWGSCSSRGTISLSRNSAFLPPHLLDSLILHELAHMHVMNHSPRFWMKLREMDERADEHRRQLNDAEHLVPAWACA